jgi:hypothetical protein
MKKFKISIIAVMALIMGIAASAFTAPVNSPTVNEWFTYDGSGPLNAPASYTYAGSTATCSGHVQFCEFKGIRQASPNDMLPTQTSLNSASSQSNNFSIEKTGLVVFQP